VWVSPACDAAGRPVAAASRNDPNAPGGRIASIWQLLPTRRQLTRPPWGWSDESPRLLPDGSLLFVRSRIASRRDGSTWLDTQLGRIMVLGHGKLVEMTEIGYRNLPACNAYLGPHDGHYAWSPILAVSG
jgi:hypothetical protein